MEWGEGRGMREGEIDRQTERFMCESSFPSTSSSRCHVLVCDTWLYFLVIITCLCSLVS